MGIGKRLSRIIKSNVNELLAAAENPEKQLALAVTEMDDALRQAKQNLIQQMAGEKRLQRQLDETDELVKLWSDKAQQAVNAGQDDLAREALRKKRTYEELATEYDRQLYEQQTAVDQLRTQYKELEQRLAEYKDRAKRIGVDKVRRDAATQQVERRVARGPRPVDTAPLVDRSAFDKFEEMADKVENFEAETQAARELNEALHPEDELATKIDRASGRAKGEQDLRADIELEELRRRAPAREAGGERLSRRREAAPPATPPAAPPADAAQPADAAKPGPDDDDSGWGRRVEL